MIDVPLSLGMPLPNMLHLPITDKVDHNNVRCVPFISVSQVAPSILQSVYNDLSNIPGGHA